MAIFEEPAEACIAGMEREDAFSRPAGAAASSVSEERFRDSSCAGFTDCLRGLARFSGSGGGSWNFISTNDLRMGVGARTQPISRIVELEWTVVAALSIASSLRLIAGVTRHDLASSYFAQTIWGTT